jgi:DNA polymerase I
MLASRVLDCGRRRPRGFHGLAEVTARALRVRLPKEEQRSDWSGPLSKAQVKYAARDVAVLLPLYERLRADVERVGLGPTLDLEHDLLPAIVAMGLAGVRVDRDGWEEAIRQREDAARHAEVAASELLEGINLRSPQQLLPVLRERLGVDLDSTSKQALAGFRGDDAVDMLLEFRRRENFPRGLGAQVLRALDSSPDGRVRGFFGQLSAPTGRMSCREPNLLAIPRDKDVRACIVPASGHTFVQADYSQIELRIAADQQREPHLLAVFADPKGDPHRLMASRMLGKPLGDVTKDERQGAKAANFGLLYGMSASGLVDYAAATYGTVITLRKAHRYRRAFFKLYRRFHRWHEKTWLQVQRARGDLQVRTVEGRIRQLERPTYRPGSLAWQRSLRAIWREALNTPVQGTGADGLKRAIVQVHPQIEALGGRLVLPVHDELIAEVPLERAGEAAGLMGAGMIAGMEHYLRRVRVEVDPATASSWAEK